MLTKRLCLSVIFALGFAGLTDGSAFAQTYPTKQIKIVVAFPPGGSVDTLARLLGEQIGKMTGQTVIVENRAGGGAIIAMEAVARAQPDGNTLLINFNGQVINAMLRKVNYDPLTSFEPICLLVNSPQLLVVNSDSPYRTLTDFVEAARAKPRQMSLASVGPGSTQQLASLRLMRSAGVELTYVPFSGGAPATNALLGGHVTAVLQNYSEAAQLLSAGKLRALATTSPGRIEPLPDLPTVAESGFANFAAEVWFGVVAPAKTPKEILSRLAGWFSVAMQVPETKAKLIAQGLYPVGMCGADFGDFIYKQYDKFGRITSDANVKAE